MGILRGMASWDLGSDEALEVILPRMESNVGDRWGGCWGIPLDSRPTIHVGVVRPTPDDIVSLTELATRHGFVVVVVGVRYSRSQLDAFIERVAAVARSNDSIYGFGPQYEMNKIGVMLNRQDPPTVTRLLAAVPADAVAFEIRLGGRFVAL